MTLIGDRPTRVVDSSRRDEVAAWAGLIVTILVVALAMAIPVMTHWDVHIGLAPIYAHWHPRWGPGTLPALVLAAAALWVGPRLAVRLSWTALLVTSTLAAFAWSCSLALVDGRQGFTSSGDVADFLSVARHVDSITGLLHGFTDRIAGPGGWPTHVAGHPPGALLWFVGMTHLGADTLVIGLVLTGCAATVPAAVLVTLRVLDAEQAARTVAPILVFAPAAIWQAVSADALYGTVTAWAVALLAVAAASRTRRPLLVASVSGVLFGIGCLLSYGLPLIGLVGIGVLIAARNVRPLLPALGGGLLVVVLFRLGGFALWEAYPQIRIRYWAGAASVRPTSYWLWGNLAALCFSAGPALGPAIGCWFARAGRVVAERRGHAEAHSDRIGWLVGGSAVVAVALADASLMSKSEVERIWLPFVPWLLVLTALLPARWRWPALAINVGAALTIQHLLVTGW